MRQKYLAVKVEFVKGCCYETNNSSENKKEHKKEAKADEETVAAEEMQETPVSLITHVSNILHSIFSNFEVYINNQKNYNSNGVCKYKSYLSNYFKGPSLNTNEFCTARGTTMKNILMNLLEPPLSEPFFTTRIKMLSRPDGFKLYGELGLIFAPLLNWYNRI